MMDYSEVEIQAATARFEGRLIDSGVGRGLKAFADPYEDGVWVTDDYYHQHPKWFYLPITLAYAAALIVGSGLQSDIAVMRKEGYSETFIRRYAEGVWRQEMRKLQK